MVAAMETKLTPVMERFIRFWGEMGDRWGVNRSVAQIHALLYLSDHPLAADDIQAALGIARSNISTSLKELQGWNLATLVHVKGDRRDHFVAQEDPFELVMTIVEGRRQREIEPARALLAELETELARDRATPETAKKRITAMRALLEDAVSWYQQVRGLPRPLLRKLMRMGAKVVSFLPK
jgi:DNA-binding transcriptional regulator GbsR (MarR family)